MTVDEKRIQDLITKGLAFERLEKERQKELDSLKIDIAIAKLEKSLVPETDFSGTEVREL